MESVQPGAVGSGKTFSSVAGLNGDRRLDILQNGYWLECPADPAAGRWTKHRFEAGWPGQISVHAADINADGRLDILMAPAESEGKLVWYEGAADPRQASWPENAIDAKISHAHTFKTADMNLDGRLDVVFGEMAQSSGKRVGFYLNGGKGGSWKLQVLSTRGTHNLRVGDFGKDGDMDMVGANWQRPPLELWENRLRQTTAPAR